MLPSTSDAMDCCPLPFQPLNRATGNSEETRAVVGKSIAMLGITLSTWQKRPFNLQPSTLHNWNDTQQKRSIVVLTGDELKYLTAQASDGGTATVTWKRAK